MTAVLIASVLFTLVSFADETDIITVPSNDAQPITEDLQISVQLNGILLNFDQPPIIVGGRTMVPLRAIFEQLGAAIEWNGETKTVTAVKEAITVSMQIDNPVISVNGNPITLDVAPIIVNGRTLVPARAVAESFGANVSWNGESRTVVITTKNFVTEDPMLMNVELFQLVGLPFSEFTAKYGQLKTDSDAADEGFISYFSEKYFFTVNTDEINGIRTVIGVNCSFDFAFPGVATGFAAKDVLETIPLPWVNREAGIDTPIFSFNGNIFICIEPTDGKIERYTRVQVFVQDGV